MQIFTFPELVQTFGPVKKRRHSKKMIKFELTRYFQYIENLQPGWMIFEVTVLWLAEGPYGNDHAYLPFPSLTGYDFVID